MRNGIYNEKQNEPRLEPKRENNAYIGVRASSSNQFPHMTQVNDSLTWNETVSLQTKSVYFLCKEEFERERRLT